MAKLGTYVDRIRSKNAGPFWLTIDIFCGDPQRYAAVHDRLDNKMVADLFQVSHNVIKRFDLPTLNVIKFSLPRPVVQGSLNDRDMHASQWGWLLDELEIGLDR